MAELLNQDTFKQKIFDYENNTEWNYNGDHPAVIDFYADWCGPCKTLAPIIDDLSTEYEGKVDFYKIDTEKEPELSTMFGIRSIPSLLFIPNDGSQPQMAQGAYPKANLKEIIEEVLGVTDPVS